MTFRESSRERREIESQPHPVWRGIGCILMVLIPIFSFAVSMVLVEYLSNNVEDFYIPFELAREYFGIENFLTVLGIGVILSLAFFALFSIFNAVIYQLSGGYTLTRFEAPVAHYKPKKKLKKRR